MGFMSESVWSRACRDFRSRHGTVWFWLAEVVVSVIVAALSASPAAFFVSMVVLACMTLLVSLVMAPIRQRDEARRKIAVLLERSAQKVRLRFESSCVKERHGIRSVGVGIKNRSNSESVHDVMLYMERLFRQNEVGDYTDISDELTYFSVNYSIGSEPFSLGPNFEKFVYVVQDSHAHPSDRPVYFHGPGSEKLPPGEYEVHLVVTGLNVPPERMKLLISKPGVDGILTARVKQ